MVGFLPHLADGGFRVGAQRLAVSAPREAVMETGISEDDVEC